jgi:hypothetical protein
MVSYFRHTHPLRGLHPIYIIAMAGLWILFPIASDSAAQQSLHHELEVEILHDAKTLRGIDTIRLPRGCVAPARGLSSPHLRILGVEGAAHKLSEGVLHLNIRDSGPDLRTPWSCATRVSSTTPSRPNHFPWTTPARVSWVPSPRMQPSFWLAAAGIHG